MSDETIADRIERLVAEEHELRHREEADHLDGERLEAEGVDVVQGGSAIRFADPEGLGLELAVTDSEAEPLTARADDIPPEHALLGFDGVRVYGPGREHQHLILTDVMGFEMTA